LGIKNIPYKKLLEHKKEIDKVLNYSAPLKKLHADLSTKSLVQAVFPVKHRTSGIVEIREKAHFEKKLKQQEAKRRRETSAILRQLKNLKKSYRNLQADWMYFYSRKAIILTLKDVFKKNHFVDNGKIYREFVRRAKLAEKGIKKNPSQSNKDALELKKKISIPLKDMLALEKALAPKKLFSSISEFASRENIKFKGKGDKKIKGVLHSLSKKNMKVIDFRKTQWNDLTSYLKNILKKTDEYFAYLKRKEIKRAELKKRIDLMGSGKYIPEEDDSDQGDNIVETDKLASAVTSDATSKKKKTKDSHRKKENTSDSEDSSTPEDSLDESDDYGEEDRLASAAILVASFNRGIRNKSGRLKTTKVKSASKKLHVQVDGFDENLHKTDKFDFNVKQSNKFDRLNASSKISTSLYTYQSPLGHAGKKDLIQFVNDVGLISFGTDDEFISYKLPSKWQPKKNIKWIKQKSAKKKVNLDRTFTYVELFIEAHRYKKGKKPSVEPQIEKKYISPNMIIIFELGGAIKRYQTFTNIRKLRLKKSDIVGGKVSYKFIKYSVRGSRIHLHGIDHEIKQAKI